MLTGALKGKISLPENRVTIGRNGSVQANISAREVVVMGKVNGNIECSDRVDIRSEGSVTGDVTTQRISVEDGAVLRGGIEVRSADLKHDKGQHESLTKPLQRRRKLPCTSLTRRRRLPPEPKLPFVKHRVLRGFPPQKDTISFFAYFFSSLFFPCGFNSSDAEFMQ